MKIPENYTAGQFVEENLPDYEKQHQGWVRLFQNPYSNTAPTFNSWINSKFPEALQAYSERLCREQREAIKDEFDNLQMYPGNHIRLMIDLCSPPEFKAKTNNHAERHQAGQD